MQSLKIDTSAAMQIKQLSFGFQARTYLRFPALSVEIGILELLQVDFIQVVRFESYTVSVELLRELLGPQLIPLVGRRAILLVRLEPLFVQLLTLGLPLVSQNAFVGLNAELIGVSSVCLVANKVVELLLGFALMVPHQILNHLVEVLLASRAGERHCVHFHSQLFHVPLNVLDRFLILRKFFFSLSVVMREVTRVQNVILDGFVVIGQRL